MQQSHFQLFYYCTGATTYKERPSKASDGYTKIVSKKKAKQTAPVYGVIGNKATEPASTVVSDAQRGRSLAVLLVTTPHFETRRSKNLFCRSC